MSSFATPTVSSAVFNRHTNNSIIVKLHSNAPKSIQETAAERVARLVAEMKAQVANERQKTQQQQQQQQQQSASIEGNFQFVFVSIFRLFKKMF